MFLKPARFCIVLVAVLFHGYCFASNDNPDVIARASALIRAHKIEQAEALLRSAAVADPNSAIVHGALGKLFLSEQRYEDSVHELGLALQTDPDFREYNMLMAEALIDGQHFSAAVNFLRAIQPRFAADPEFHYDLGLAHYNLNDNPEAKQELAEALRLDPKFDRAAFLLAGCLDAEGNFAEAADIHRKLVQQQPDNATYWVMLGEALQQVGSENGPEAVRACRRALALKPGDPRVQYVAATVFNGAGNFGAARPLLEHLARLHPNDLGVHILLSQVYARLGEGKLARQEAAKANELRTQNAAGASTTPTPDKNNGSPQP